MVRVEQSLLLVVAMLSTFVVIADEAADLEAFNAAYSAYQEYADQKDFNRATPEAKVAYELSQQIFGLEHQNTASLAYNYGLALIEIEDEAEAKQILRETLSLYKAAYGKDSTELIPVLMDLGRVSAEAYRPANQIRYYNRALALAADHYGRASQRYGRLSLEAGVGLLNEAQTPDAEIYLQDAYRILRNVLGEESDITGIAAFQLARFEVAIQQYGAAEGHLLAALKTFADPDRPSTQIEMSAHAWLVAIYEETGESQKATAHCLAIGRMTPIGADQEYLPLFKKTPKYPVAARQRGLEGSVLVKFSVDQDGFVREPQVVEIKGHKGFESATIEAVKEFRYAPRFVEGAPVATDNVYHIITFTLAD